MIILTLFGTTRGLELQHFPLTNSAPHLKFDDAWIGVTPSQVNLRSAKDAVVVFRRRVGEHLATWIGIYRPAREMGYDRPGGFYGAGVWIIDQVADAKLLIDVLREMAGQVQLNTMSGDSFVKKIADARNEFTPPSQVSSLLASLTEVKLGFKPEGESAFVVEDVNPIVVIEWAQRAPSAEPFSKVVIGSADQLPASGQSAAFSIFTSLSLAIDTAYQRLSSQFRHAMSDTHIRVQNLSQKIDDLNKANLGLTDDLNDARMELRKVNSMRMHPSSTVDPYSGLYSLMGETQIALDSRSLPNADRLQPQPSTRLEQSVSSRGPVSTAQTQRRTTSTGRMASADDPSGQAKTRPTAPIAFSDEDSDKRPHVNYFLYVVIFAFIVLVVLILGIYFKDNDRGCTLWSIGCSKEPARTSQRNSSGMTPLAPLSSEQSLESGGSMQRP